MRTHRICLTISACQADIGFHPTINPVHTMEKKTLREKLFGAKHATATPRRKEETLAKINEPDSGAKPRARRTIGLTEERLRAANRQSWITSGKGWSDLFGRFTR
jgi:hypothetical protein